MRAIALIFTFFFACSALVYAGPLDVRKKEYEFQYGGIAKDEATDKKFVIGEFDERKMPKKVKKALKLKLNFGGEKGITLETEVGPNGKTKTNFEAKKKALVNLAAAAKKKTNVTKEDVVKKPIVEKKIKLKKSASCNELPKVYFELASSKVDSDDVAKLISALKACGDKKVNLKVSGYTCDIGTKDFNDDLAKKRAESVASELRKNGFDVSLVEGVGRAFYATKDLSKRELNRRAEVSVTQYSSN